MVARNSRWRRFHWACRRQGGRAWSIAETGAQQNFSASAQNDRAGRTWVTDLIYSEKMLATARRLETVNALCALLECAADFPKTRRHGQGDRQRSCLPNHLRKERRAGGLMASMTISPSRLNGGVDAHRSSRSAPSAHRRLRRGVMPDRDRSRRRRCLLGASMTKMIFALREALRTANGRAIVIRSARQDASLSYRSERHRDPDRNPHRSRTAGQLPL